MTSRLAPTRLARRAARLVLQINITTANINITYNNLTIKLIVKFSNNIASQALWTILRSRCRVVQIAPEESPTDPVDKTATPLNGKAALFNGELDLQWRLRQFRLRLNIIRTAETNKSRFTNLKARW